MSTYQGSVLQAPLQISHSKGILAVQVPTLFIFKTQALVQ